MKLQIKNVQNRFKLMRLVILFLLLAGTGFYRVSAQQRVNKNSFDAAVKKLRETTRVPLRLPTVFPYPPDAAAAEKRKTVYAIEPTANTDSFEFDLCYSRTTCHSAYFYAEISGEKLSENPEKLFGKEVGLARGITGYFQESSCGASCAPDSISWDQDGYRYTVFFNVGDDVKTLVDFVNSAVNNDSLIETGAAGFPSVKIPAE